MCSSDLDLYDVMTTVNLATPVHIAEMPDINHKQHIMLLGSCFAENIGEWLLTGSFRVDVNPYGILYNPFSIASALDEMIRHRRYSDDDLFNYRGLWHSVMHHGCFSSASVQTVVDDINKRIDEAAGILQGKLDRLLITFGTAYIYQ